MELSLCYTISVVKRADWYIKMLAFNYGLLAGGTLALLYLPPTCCHVLLHAEAQLVSV